MTVKRTWIDKKGKLHEKELKPGYTERIRTVFNDAECKGYLSLRSGIVRVVNSDELQYEKKDTFLMRVLGSSINRENEGETTTYRREMVNALATGKYCSNDEVVGQRKQKISFKWEPTLPQAARK